MKKTATKCKSYCYFIVSDQIVKYMLTFNIFYCFNFCYAQNINLDYKHAIKIYNLTTIEQYDKQLNTSPLTESVTAYQFLNPTIAFQWKTKRNNFHEAELTTFNFNKKTTSFSNGYGYPVGTNTVTTSISGRYEYVFNFNKSKDHKFVPSLGTGIGLYYKQDSFAPNLSSTYTTIETFWGARAFITPRITYYVSHRVFIDLNIPVCLSDTHYFIKKDNDPTIIESKRTSTTLQADVFPESFSGRIGIGFKL